jgi:hypothetical protein
MTCIFHRMKTHTFGVTCPNMIFAESIPVPSEDEKYWVDISCLGCIGMHYVTRRSHRIQKHKFGITCPEALLVKSVPVPPEHEK